MDVMTKPADDYDVEAWLAYYGSNPGGARSVGADAEDNGPAPDDEPEEDQVSPDAEEEPSEDETAAEEEKPEAVSDEEAEEEAEEVPAKGRSEAFQKLLAKYGGDEAKLAEAYFEQAGSVSRLAKDMAELKQALLSKEDDGKEYESAMQQDQSLRTLYEDAASTRTDLQQAQQKQMGFITQFNTVNTDLARLEGEYKRADEVDKVIVRQELDEKKRELSELKSSFERNEEYIKRANRELRTQERLFYEAQAQVKERVDNDKKQRLQLASMARQSRDDFNVAMRAEAKKYGVDSSSKLYGFMHQGIKAQIVDVLKTMDPEGKGIDMEEAVASLVGEFAKETGLKKKFRQTSELKTQASTPQKESASKVEQRPGQPKSLGARMKTGAYWKQRAAEIIRTGKAS